MSKGNLFALYLEGIQLDLKIVLDQLEVYFKASNCTIHMHTLKSELLVLFNLQQFDELNGVTWHNLKLCIFN